MTETNQTKTDTKTDDTSGGGFAVFIVVAILFGPWAWSTANQYIEELTNGVSAEEAAENEAAQRAHQAEQRMLAKRHDSAKSIAEDIVGRQLRAPSTASWVGTKVVAEQYPHYVVHVVVDSQNGFGAMIRDSFLTAFEITDMNDNSYRVKPFSSMIRSSNPPDRDGIRQMQDANWPEKHAAQ